VTIEMTTAVAVQLIAWRQPARAAFRNFAKYSGAKSIAIYPARSDKILVTFCYLQKQFAKYSHQVCGLWT
jgi:hypothetical protein